MKKIAKRILVMSIMTLVTLSMGLNIICWLSYVGCLSVGRSDLLQDEKGWVQMLYLNLPTLVFSLYAWLSNWNTRRITKFMELDETVDCDRNSNPQVD